MRRELPFWMKYAIIKQKLPKWKGNPYEASVLRKEDHSKNTYSGDAGRFGMFDLFFDPYPGFASAAEQGNASADGVHSKNDSSGNL